MQDSVTLAVAGAKVIIPAETLTKLWLSQLQRTTDTQPTTAAPRIGAFWSEQLGTYAGIGRGLEGAADHHLIVAENEWTSITWQAAMDAAQALPGGFTLPTRSDQALCFANVPELFEKDWYWSCEQCADDAQYAWFQSFSGGRQDSYLKDGRMRARAVRRVPIS